MHAGQRRREHAGRQEWSTVMRLSAGGCYRIEGIEVRRVADDPAERVGLARWRERQEDLWAESSTIAHENRSLTAQECALWHAMWRELEVIKATIVVLESDAPPPAAP
jgi:hypothetical protein